MLINAVLVAYLIHTVIRPRLKAHRWLELPLATATFSAVTMGVYIYLQPISQFIYFQF